MLNYSPNAIARAMALQRTDKIAFLICKAHSSILDEFYAGICEGIMKESNAYDYQLLISTEEDWIAATNSAKRKQIEGVILGGNAQPERVLDFQNRNIHVVMVNNRIAGMNLPYVLSDERDGTRQVVQHLVERGHQKISMIAGRFSPYICSERYSAFVDAMKEHGLKVDSRYIRMSDPDIDSAVEIATELLRQKDPPTAIFGANDVIAIGAIKAALRLGLRIPRDVAIVGYYDSSSCRTTEPELTSVHIDRMRGRSAWKNCRHFCGRGNCRAGKRTATLAEYTAPANGTVARPEYHEGGTLVKSLTYADQRFGQSAAALIALFHLLAGCHGHSPHRELKGRISVIPSTLTLSIFISFLPKGDLAALSSTACKPRQSLWSFPLPSACALPTSSPAAGFALGSKSPPPIGCFWCVCCPPLPSPFLCTSCFPNWVFSTAKRLLSLPAC